MSATLHGEAVEVLRAAGKALHVNDIWEGIRSRGVYKAASNTPEQSLATQLLRKTPGVDVTAATDEKLFCREGPNIFGLLEWKSDQSQAGSVEAEPKGAGSSEGRQEQFVLPDEVPVQEPLLVEGATRTIIVNAYERNPEARRRCIAAHQPRCFACGFDFGAVYGPEFAGFIHVHHVRPLSEVGGEYAVDPVKDLRPVCPNCHAVIHHGGQLRSIEDVRQLLARQSRAEPSAAAVDGGSM